MSKDGQVPRQHAAPTGPGVVDPFDPGALEARLVEARARRAEVLARRTGGGTTASHDQRQKRHALNLAAFWGARSVDAERGSQHDLGVAVRSARPKFPGIERELVSRGRILPALPGRLVAAGPL